MICRNRNLKELQEQYSQHSESFEKHWSEENCGNHVRSSLTPDFVLNNCSNLHNLCNIFTKLKLKLKVSERLTSGVVKHLPKCLSLVSPLMNKPKAHFFTDSVIQLLNVYRLADT